MFMSIRENLSKLELNNAKLVAVTKGVPAKTILESVSYGVTDIAENYVQEAEEKFKHIGRKVKWHFIGHLQRNKVSQAVRLFDVIQTVDSLRLAKKINRAAEHQEKIIKVMIQVNVSGDKHGVEPEHVRMFYNELTGLRHLEVIGLMCIADIENPRLSFKRMSNLNSKLKLPYLSMGMSNDYKTALEEGSNMVRLGTAIYGKRNKGFLEQIVGDIADFFREVFS
ncbi:YggS family pyridoxal phosphate-dependent enzyme [Candidatus Woesearchaeota archaeon]|nr:MAG: YggS family pyridoxal phosphate-dependent enzyme [Candidatus Woesearchaeota archaeon]